MSRTAVFEASLRYFLTPIGPFLDDPSVTEVMVNGHQQVFVERKGCIEATDATFPSEDALRSAVNNLAQSVGREIGDGTPCSTRGCQMVPVFMRSFRPVREAERV